MPKKQSRAASSKYTLAKVDAEARSSHAKEHVASCRLFLNKLFFSFFSFIFLLPLHSPLFSSLPFFLM